MPILAGGRFEIDEGEMVEMMGGHYPPKDALSRDAYFAVFEDAVMTKYGQEGLDYIQLLSGPDEYWKWYNPRT
jgi:hypothetical protein